ncbi:MAG: hypothetical protein H7282_01310, partial [Cytophagaceae bacterium]|nr:hypothetical protein [Cytophagaceae bacterium]
MKKLTLILMLFASTFIAAHAQTQYIKGLTVIAEFTDAPFTNYIDSVGMMMNQTGFNGWGNDGSLREYYLLQTNGKVDITNTVIKISLNYPVSAYYDDNSRHDMADIVEQINLHYPNGFQNLTTYPDGSIMHFSVLTKAGRGAWSFGDQNVSPIKNNGVNAKVANGSLTHYGHNNNPSYNTICHETGHAVFGWGDYYDIHSNFGQIGHYCLMGSGGNDARPMPISAPLRNTKAWINTVTDITNATTQTFSITTNDYAQVYKYVNPANPKEYFLIDAHKHDRSYLTLDGENFPLDEGLAVWYVDEDRGAGAKSPYIKLIQADGLDEMTDLSLETPELKVNLRGDLTDLFDSEFPTLNASTHATLRWKDGSVTGLSLSHISAVSTVMTFKFNSRFNIPPVVNLTSPTVLSYTAPATVTLSAQATDEGVITKVEFYNGSTLLNTDLTAPYTYSWTGVGAGNYKITAKAYDNSDASTVSAPVSITVTNTNGGVCTGTAINGDYSYKVTASNGTATILFTPLAPIAGSTMALLYVGINNGAVSGMYMNASGNNFIQSFSAPVGSTLTFYFTYRVGTSGVERNSNANPHTVIAGNCTNNVAPTVTLTSPLNGQTFTAGATVTLSANASDSDGSVNKVEFYNGTILLNTDLTAPYTYSWTSVTAGTYAITAKATDNVSATTVSSTVSITVNTVRPAVCTGNSINGDYSYEVSSSNGTATILFIPKAPIAGSTMALLYVGINNGAVSGMYMNASGNNFTKSFSAPAGSTLTFYFTYRVGTSGVERNSNANPHTVIAGNCTNNVAPTV